MYIPQSNKKNLFSDQSAMQDTNVNNVCGEIFIFLSNLSI